MMSATLRQRKRRDNTVAYAAGVFHSPYLRRRPTASAHAAVLGLVAQLRFASLAVWDHLKHAEMRNRRHHQSDSRR